MINNITWTAVTTNVNGKPLTSAVTYRIWRGVDPTAVMMIGTAAVNSYSDAAAPADVISVYQVSALSNGAEGKPSAAMTVDPKDWMPSQVVGLELTSTSYTVKLA